METTDADLGYMKMYIKHIHDFLESGEILGEQSVLDIHEIHNKMVNIVNSVLARQKGTT